MANSYQLTLESRKLLISAALDLTRLKPKLRKACLMVLANGLSAAAAARKIGRPPQNVRRALLQVRRKLADVEAEANKLATE